MRTGARGHLVPRSGAGACTPPTISGSPTRTEVVLPRLADRPTVPDAAVGASHRDKPGASATARSTGTHRTSRTLRGASLGGPWGIGHESSNHGSPASRPGPRRWLSQSSGPRTYPADPLVAASRGRHPASPPGRQPASRKSFMPRRFPHRVRPRPSLTPRPRTQRQNHLDDRDRNPDRRRRRTRRRLGPRLRCRPRRGHRSHQPRRPNRRASGPARRGPRGRPPPGPGRG